MFVFLKHTHPSTLLLTGICRACVVGSYTTDSIHLHRPFAHFTNLARLQRDADGGRDTRENLETDDAPRPVFPAAAAEGMEAPDHNRTADEREDEHEGVHTLLWLDGDLIDLEDDANDGEDEDNDGRSAETGSSRRHGRGCRRKKRREQKKANKKTKKESVRGYSEKLIFRFGRNGLGSGKSKLELVCKCVCNTATPTPEA